MTRFRPALSVFISPLVVFAAIALVTGIPGCHRAASPAPSADTMAMHPQSGSQGIQPKANVDTSARAWIGSYSFDQVWATEGQDFNNVITYELNVHLNGDSLQANLDADGYMTSIHAYCDAVGDAKHLDVLFREVGEENTFDQYQPGDTLFTLVARGDTTLTFWKKMQPDEEDEVENGTPYFKKQ